MANRAVGPSCSRESSGVRVVSREFAGCSKAVFKCYCQVSLLCMCHSKNNFNVFNEIDGAVSISSIEGNSEGSGSIDGKGVGTFQAEGFVFWYVHPYFCQVYCVSSTQQSKSIIVVVFIATSIVPPISIVSIDQKGRLCNDVLDVSPRQVGVGLQHQGDHSRCEGGCGGGASETVGAVVGAGASASVEVAGGDPLASS